jgi:hypothetical protein
MAGAIGQKALPLQGLLSSYTSWGSFVYTVLSHLCSKAENVTFCVLFFCGILMPIRPAGDCLN